MTESGSTLQNWGGNVVLCAQNQQVGLDTDLLKLFDGVLRRFCLQLFGGVEERNVGQMDADGVAAHLPAQLAHALEERQALDVAYGSADFGYYEIVVAGVAEQLHVALDLVGDVGYDLDGLAEIVAAAFVVDDVLVDPTGRDIIGARCADIGEPLVVAEVEIGLLTVDGYVAFAVFVGVESARVDVDIRVELLDGDAVAASLKQAGERCRDNSFTE